MYAAVYSITVYKCMLCPCFFDFPEISTFLVYSKDVCRIAVNKCMFCQWFFDFSEIFMFLIFLRLSKNPHSRMLQTWLVRSILRSFWGSFWWRLDSLRPVPLGLQLGFTVGIYSWQQLIAVEHSSWQDWVGYFSINMLCIYGWGFTAPPPMGMGLTMLWVSSRQGSTRIRKSFCAACQWYCIIYLIYNYG